MIAAVLTNPGSFELKTTAKPAIQPNEVLVQVAGCGICASSLPLWEGREWFQYPVAPGSPGHEGWGLVEAIGDEVRTVKTGDHVAFLSGHAYAEYDVTNENSLVKLPASLQGKPFPGEPLGCAMNIFERSDIKAGDTVAVIGIGFLGALLCQLAKHAGAKVIAISRRQYSLDYAKQYGADELIPLTATWEVSNKISELTGGAFCDRVIEATGKQEAIDVATEIVSEGGRLIIAGYHQDGLRQVNMQKWNWKGIDVINAHERKPERYLHGMQQAVTAVENGVIQPGALYTDLLSMDQLAEGFKKTSARPDGFMKAIITL
ncbi:MDR/zinc-dependent alcohol dehydrogenase-like family protein [Aridibaculum aurantiacum]|uniref:MDR/zinc-dependent alcohol dehydrogenase-like family protein n=1 Tax=Aridibaculum aurantiacum TaxID=2810307 RepID=UPI001A96810D|nr:zinc-binding dehydrogenase [Aridibaculum aurantiacum]